MLVTFTVVETGDKLLIECPPVFDASWWGKHMWSFANQYSEGGFVNLACSHPVECKFTSGDRPVHWRWDNPNGTPRRIL